MKRTILFAFVFAVLTLVNLECTTDSTQPKFSPVITISTAMPAPDWAVEERNLFALYDSASRLFADNYLAENGFMKVVERWGGNDGPDDAMENFSHWPLVYALGGPDALLEIYKKAWAGHLVQFTKAKAPDVEMAKDGMYYKEFITSFDWEHNGEGLSAFNFYGLSNPDDSVYRRRMMRFAGFYMNEDPDAPNYDPEHKIIRSLHNGSRGPKLTDASVMDWGGEPVEGHPERLERYTTAANIRGDHPLNLLSTTLAMNAYLLTGEKKYRDWILEYAGAWRDRVLKNGGNIPTNIGLDGKIGGEWDGKWYGGTFGWNFWPQSKVRNYFIRGPRVAFGNAFMLTQDQSFITPLQQQIDNLYAAKKDDGSRILLPNKYGDDGWYGYMRPRHSDVLRDIYLWSMDTTKLTNLNQDPWINFLLGKNPDYPETAIQNEMKYISWCMDEMYADTVSEEIRDTDDPQKLNPVKGGTLVHLTTGGNDPGIAGNILHCRVRYFDPDRKRAGLPDNVAALVQKITPDGIELTLVNTNTDQARRIILQAGAYGEHQFTKVIIEDQQIPVNNHLLSIDFAPGAGSKMILKMNLYANSPSLKLPW